MKVVVEFESWEEMVKFRFGRVMDAPQKTEAEASVALDKGEVRTFSEEDLPSRIKQSKHTPPLSRIKSHEMRREREKERKEENGKIKPRLIITGMKREKANLFEYCKKHGIEYGRAYYAVMKYRRIRSAITKKTIAKYTPEELKARAAHARSFRKTEAQGVVEGIKNIFG